MGDKFDNFYKELRTKIDSAEKRIKDLNASAKSAGEKARLDAQAQLAELEKRAKDQLVKVKAAEAKAKSWADEKKAITSDKIAAWKAQHEAEKLVAYADFAEDYAVGSIELAIAAVEEAERAAVEALAARIDAQNA